MRFTEMRQQVLPQLLGFWFARFAILDERPILAHPLRLGYLRDRVDSHDRGEYVGAENAFSRSLKNARTRHLGNVLCVFSPVETP